MIVFVLFRPEYKSYDTLIEWLSNGTILKTQTVVAGH